jgi:hypothetical protein
MTKIRTTITVDKEMLNLAHHHKIRISTFLDSSLRDYLGRINGSNNLRKVEAAGSNPAQSIDRITDKSIVEYLSFLELKGVTKGHLNEVHRYLNTTKR